MNEAQNKAWECLTDVEQKSLYLQLAQGKSSWEAGQVLSISHYKYLEIKDRSQRLFKLFSEFYDCFTDIFRPDGPVTDIFRDYIYGCLERRLKPGKAAQLTGDSTQSLPDIRRGTIIKNMKRLHDSDNIWDQQTWALICEFDRWNNFRILPKLIQQPSAFKRRVNKKHKSYIKYILDRIPRYLHKLIKEKYYYKAKPSIKKRYICLVSEELYDEGYYVMPFKTTKEALNEATKHYIYVFNDKSDAEDFGFLVSRYRAKTANVRLGQRFWPEYLFTINKAINYNEVNNLDFNIQVIENAYCKSFNKPTRKSRKESRVPFSL